MTTRWQLLQELFEATVELDPPERARVLRERAAGDADLAREVEELVASDGSPAGELERSGVEILGSLGADPPAAELCGAAFGPYRIEEHLSSGGMGHVYRATRSAAGTERRVALKVLRSRVDLDALLERFQRERQVLAALEHEHVVAFLDAGALPDGRPFLVMEYVDGVPITEWAAAAGATARERIELFVEVATAVQYAHQKLIVHRDLKPSNVLVTAQGAPKLLDFGVASVLAPPDVGGEPEPAGRAPLTPSYAAPEELAGAPPTTAGDVYSLGVLLHELLTGELPRPGRQPGLGRDLDAILATALATDPARRYPSADRLADDLRRHLAREPVGARAGSAWYRAACFARRRRWSLATAAAVVVGLIAGWIGSDLERRAAERESSRGWGAHAQAKVTARLLESWLLERAAADGALGASTARHLEAALRDELAGLGEAETLVRLTLARLYLDRGEDARAVEHAERAWELAQSTPGIGPLERERAAELRALIRARRDE